MCAGPFELLMHVTDNALGAEGYVGRSLTALTGLKKLNLSSQNVLFVGVFWGLILSA